MRKPVIVKYICIFTAICALFAVTGCSMPIGTIYGKAPVTAGYKHDPMWLVPRKQLYEIDDRFMRNEHFQIFVVDDGAVREVDPEDEGVAVRLLYNEGLSTEQNYTVADATHQFFAIGPWKVEVDYLERSGYYMVEVYSPNNGGGSIGGDGGIGIIWLE